MKGKWFVGFWFLAGAFAVLAVAFGLVVRGAEVSVVAPPAQYMVVREDCSTCKALEELLLQGPAPREDPSLYGEHETF
jgi:hypothetical protein